MAGMTNYFEITMLNAALRGISYTSTPVYVGLFTSVPNDLYTSSVPTGVEVSGNAYARQQVVFGAPSGSPAVTTNTNVITFPAADPAGWGTVVAFGIFDAVSGGNMTHWSTLLANKTILASDIFQFGVGAISVLND